jgi:DNA polymerase-3 subunit alpha
MNDTDKTYKNLAECRRVGIPVLPPGVNESQEGFTVQDGTIRFGLGAVKGVGTKAVEAMINVRAETPFTSLHDFCLRVRSGNVNKRVVEGLIKCGAFDAFGVPRAQLFAAADDVLRWAGLRDAESDASQMGLFASGAGFEAPPPALPPAPEWVDKERLRAERDALGFFITGHPLDKFEASLRRFTTVTSGLRSRQHKEKVKVAGVVHSLKLKNSRKGDRYATFVLEDKEGIVDVIVWPEAYRRGEAILHGDDPICLTGTLDIDEERVQIIAEEIVSLAAAREEAVRQVHVRLSADAVDAAKLQRLRGTLAEHHGDCQAYLHLIRGEDNETIIALPEDLRVRPSEEMLETVEQLFGVGVVHFQ